MIKNTWYLEKKKIVLDKGYFYWIIIGVFLYVFISSIIFLVQYFIKEKWDILVDKNQTIFGIKNLTYQERQNRLKIIYLTRFIGTISSMILYQFSAYIYFKKLKYGYAFVIFWLFVSIGLVAVDIGLISSDPILMVWKLIPSILLSIINIILIFELQKYRQRLKQKFYLKVKKGEI